MKQFTAPMLHELRNELNEAVLAVAEKHGITIQFGNATYQELTAKFNVSLAFAASDNFDPEKALWDQNCAHIGLDAEDFGKKFTFLGETEIYRIIGFKPKARTNCVRIRRVRDGKEFVTSAMEIRVCLGKTQTKQVSPPSADAQVSKEEKAKAEWNMYCRMYGLTPEDFDAAVLLSGKFYRICGIKPNARTNNILIRNTISGKEYVTSPDTIKAALKRP